MGRAAPRRLAVALLGAFTLTAGAAAEVRAAQGADDAAGEGADAGAYAIKGVGRTACGDYVRAYAGAAASEGKSLLPFAGWLDGYMTGFNHFQAGTYDVAPWQTTELMLAMVAKHCGTHRDRLFVEAVNDLLLVLYPDRLAAESEIVRVENAGQAVFLYRGLLEEVRVRLVAAGLSPGGENAPYDRAFATALKTYQARRGLPASGLPDQATMNALFLADETVRPGQSAP